MFSYDRKVSQGDFGQRRAIPPTFETHRVFIHLDDLLNDRGVVHVVGVASGRHLMHEVEGEHHIFRGELFSVLPSHIRTQVHFPGRGSNRTSLGGQPWLDFFRLR